MYISIPFFTDEAVHAELTADDWAKTVVVDDTDGFFAEHRCLFWDQGRGRSWGTGIRESLIALPTPRHASHTPTQLLPYR